MSQMTRASISIAVAVAMVALLSSKVAAEEPPPQPARVEVGQEAPLFELDSSDGESLRLAELRGESPLILIFFRGTW